MAIITRAEYLELDGTPLATPAWEIVDLSPLWDFPPMRGADVVLPYAPGRIPKPRRVDAARVTLPMVVFGDRDADGDVYPDPRAGLRANLDALWAAILEPPGGDGTRTAILHLPTAPDTVTGPVTVLSPLALAPVNPSTVRATLDLSIPGGMLGL